MPKEEVEKIIKEKIRKTSEIIQEQFNKDEDEALEYIITTLMSIQNEKKKEYNLKINDTEATIIRNALLSDKTYIDNKEAIKIYDKIGDIINGKNR